MAIVLIARERPSDERRVAGVPATVKKLVEAGLEVVVETGAGTAAGFPDDAYAEVGAEIVADDGEAWSRADIVCAVAPPRVEEASVLRGGAILISFVAPHRNLELVRTLADRGVRTLAMELIPRISRAQSMDALTSQSTISGYRAVVMAAARLDKYFPLTMTAAGTIRPATVVVLGAGVAGLQAIATAKRLGAVVRANDIREAAKQEVESLGAEFIDIEEEATDAEDESGYAKEVDEDFLQKQRRVLSRHLEAADAVITTAIVPGRPAPELVTEEMVECMRPGSVLIDLAAAEGGNCVLTGEEESEHNGVRIIPAPDLPSQMAGEASRLYARNVADAVRLFLVDGDAGEIRVDREDEILHAALLTADGDVLHEPTAERLQEEGT